MRVIDALESVAAHAGMLASGGPLRDADAIAASCLWSFYRRDVLDHYRAHEDPGANPTQRLAGLIAHCVLVTHGAHPYRLILHDAAFAGFVSRVDDGRAPIDAVRKASAGSAGTPGGIGAWLRSFLAVGVEAYSVAVGLFGQNDGFAAFDKAAERINLDNATLFLAAPAHAADALVGTLRRRDARPDWSGPLWPGAPLSIVYRSASQRARP
jgi:hypothetical protein